MSIFKPDWEPVIMYSWKIVQLMNQKMRKGELIRAFERAERAPWVRLIFEKDTWEICITREWRSELNNWKWWYDYRLPWGKVFDSLGNYNKFRDSNWDVLKAAKDKAIEEWKEEVGAIFTNSEHIHTSQCGATMRRDLHYFKISDFEIQDQALEDWEDITVLWMNPEEVRAKCLDGSIQEDRSVAVLLRYLQ